MDARARSGRLLLKTRLRVAPVVVAASLVACAASKSGAPVGVSAGAGPEHGAPPKDAGPKPQIAGLPADFRASFAKLTRAPFVSNGHAGARWDAEVYVNAIGKEALYAKTGEVPAGTQLVMEHFEREAAPGSVAERQRGPIFSMVKLAERDGGDGWRYLVVNSKGDLVKDGQIESCAGCHGDAPRDHLFIVGD